MARFPRVGTAMSSLALIIDYEHAPPPGAAAWIGAGVPTLVGGVAMLWALASSSGDRAMVVLGGTLVVAGLVTVAAGIRHARRHLG